jgi:hypothetical protein
LARCQSESVLAGGDGDGGLKLRPNGYGARHRLGTAGGGGGGELVSSATEPKFSYQFGSFSFSFMFDIRPLFVFFVSYSAFCVIFGDLFGLFHTSVECVIVGQ